MATRNGRSAVVGFQGGGDESATSLARDGKRPASATSQSSFGPGGKSASASPSAAGAASGTPAAAGDSLDETRKHKLARQVEDYGRILDATDVVPNYSAIKSLFEGNEGCASSDTVPSIHVSFELFETVQNRFANTKQVLERTKADLLSRSQQYSQLQGELQRVQDEYAVSKNRATEAEDRNTALHQQIAKLEVMIEQLQKEAGQIRTEMSVVQEKLVYREEELQASQNRVAEGLVTISQKEAAIATLRRELAKYGRFQRRGGTGKGEGRKDGEGGEDGDGEYTQEALESIAADVEGRSKEARMKLNLADLEARAKRTELEKQFVLQQHDEYRKHVEQVMASMESQTMEMHDAIATHACITTPFFLSSTYYDALLHPDPNAPTAGAAETSVESFYALSYESRRALDRLKKVSIDADSRLHDGLCDSIAAQQQCVHASAELIGFLSTLEKEITTEKLSLPEMKEEWRKAQVPFFASRVAKELTDGVAAFNRSLVRLLQQENEVYASATHMAAAAASSTGSPPGTRAGAAGSRLPPAEDVSPPSRAGTSASSAVSSSPAKARVATKESATMTEVESRHHVAVQAETHDDESNGGGSKGASNVASSPSSASASRPRMFTKTVQVGAETVDRPSSALPDRLVAAPSAQPPSSSSSERPHVDVDTAATQTSAAASREPSPSVIDKSRPGSSQSAPALTAQLPPSPPRSSTAVCARCRQLLQAEQQQDEDRAHGSVTEAGGDGKSGKEQGLSTPSAVPAHPTAMTPTTPAASSPASPSSSARVPSPLGVVVETTPTRTGAGSAPPIAATPPPPLTTPSSEPSPQPSKPASPAAALAKGIVSTPPQQEPAPAQRPSEAHPSASLPESSALVDDEAIRRAVEAATADLQHALSAREATQQAALAALQAELESHQSATVAELHAEVSECHHQITEKEAEIASLRAQLETVLAGRTTSGPSSSAAAGTGAPRPGSSSSLPHKVLGDPSHGDESPLPPLRTPTQTNKTPARAPSAGEGGETGSPWASTTGSLVIKNPFETTRPLPAASSSSTLPQGNNKNNNSSSSIPVAGGPLSEGERHELSMSLPRARTPTPPVLSASGGGQSRPTSQRTTPALPPLTASTPGASTELAKPSASSPPRASHDTAPQPTSANASSSSIGKPHTTETADSNEDGDEAAANHSGQSTAAKNSAPSTAAKTKKGTKKKTAGAAGGTGVASPARPGVSGTRVSAGLPSKRASSKVKPTTSKADPAAPNSTNAASSGSGAHKEQEAPAAADVGTGGHNGSTHPAHTKPVAGTQPAPPKKGTSHAIGDAHTHSTAKDDVHADRHEDDAEEVDDDEYDARMARRAGAASRPPLPINVPSHVGHGVPLTPQEQRAYTQFVLAQYQRMQQAHRFGSSLGMPPASAAATYPHNGIGIVGVGLGGSGGGGGGGMPMPATFYFNNVHYDLTPYEEYQLRRGVDAPNSGAHTLPSATPVAPPMQSLPAPAQGFSSAIMRPFFTRASTQQYRSWMRSLESSAGGSRAARGQQQQQQQSWGSRRPHSAGEAESPSRLHRGRAPLSPRNQAGVLGRTADGMQVIGIQPRLRQAQQPRRPLSAQQLPSRAWWLARRNPYTTRNKIYVHRARNYPTSSIAYDGVLGHRLV